MDFLTIMTFVAIIVAFAIYGIYIYLCLATTNAYVEKLSTLFRRTFREYYNGQDIEPVMINGGIDLKWTGEVKGIKAENELGFISIYTNDNNLNSPIDDLEEADIVAEKITKVIYDHIRDKEEL